ncbi:MAG: acetyl-CoA carboxylase biotin carboxyl carrier protein [Candidatus Nanoarchaeia archaeon]
MKIDDIRTIVELMSEHDLTEFKIEADEMHICIKRGSHATSQHTPVPVVTTAPVIPSPVVVESPKVVPSVPNNTTPESPKEERPTQRNTINAPIVGTFYKAPAPDAEPFVKIGSKVTPDTVVCIIEAMKVMNEIKAEKTGVIKEVLVENGQPVEFGQPLFVIE